MNTGMRFNMNLGGRFSCWSILPLDAGTKIVEPKSLTVIISIQHLKDKNIYVKEDAAYKNEIETKVW